MNSQKALCLFKDYRIAVQNIQKILKASACLNMGQGTRVVQKARKYRRPEDLEDPQYKGLGPKPAVKSVLQSIADRGFARELPSYKPPVDVEEQLHKMCKKLFGSQLSSDWKGQTLDDPLLKFKVLTKCVETFKKNIPNTELHKMKTLADVYTYYCTPVDGCLPYNALVRDSDQLPPNLYVMSETKPFNPTTDTFFGGITAFPGRKRIIYTKTGEKFEKVLEWPNI